ncbi:MAG: type I-U CRISPR-associated helicase/endonuclease Cas3 [Caldilineaceae bacterium]|nr:type I-U CRISPR-associated helicase/endonuclease Cas3 [Caldilineaceae bacterium]
MTLKPTFSEFYQACNCHEPFPWQDRLANSVAETGAWPAEIGVPTGLGKTSCLDIAVWWLASQADREPAARTAPTRIWWVVNRRLLVDATAAHAKHIADTLEDPREHVTGRALQTVLAVQQQLKSLSVGRTRVLDVIRLRGGIAGCTPINPSCPTIILCTLPMYGSRLLFRGYGSRLRSVDAAMAGTDSLILLDEAHLVPHLQNLIPALDECMPGTVSILGERRSRPQLTSLTATGRAQLGQRFDLDDSDKAHPIVKQRIHAAKPLEIRECKGEAGKQLAEGCSSLLKGRPPSAVVIFANTPGTARKAFEHVRKRHGKEAEVLLLTGRQREREAERLRARILDPQEGMADTITGQRRQHLIVVATQTLEVGADIDAEFMVTEACGVRALTQRLGRLNRFGHHVHARAVYVHIPPKGKKPEMSWPVYGAEPGQVLKRLQDAIAEGGTGKVDLSPARVAKVLQDPVEDTGRAPEVMQGILWEWVKTTTPPEGEAPVEPYFAGISGAQYSVSLIWRAHVPKGGKRLWPRATDREAMEVPLREVREVLDAAETIHRLAPDNLAIQAVTPVDLRPGDRIVLPADRGLMDEFGWNPEASNPVMDVSLPRQGLPLDAPAIQRLCGVDVKGYIDVCKRAFKAEGADQDASNKAVLALLDAIRAAPAPDAWEELEWSNFVDSLQPDLKQSRHSVPRLYTSDRENTWNSSDLDETSLVQDTVEAIGLDAHGAAVADLATRTAEKIGISPRLVRVAEEAGQLHDIGKADHRFQRWLKPDFDPEQDTSPKLLRAKSNTPRHLWEATRAAAGWPRGGRHEELSARVVRIWLQQRKAVFTPQEQDLLIHLIASHHGKGRPFTMPVPDDSPAQVSSLIDGMRVQASANLAIADWEQPARFRGLNQWLGPWGLSLMEAIVTLADHRVSAGDHTIEETEQ